jgi:hypothetical protein
VLQSRSSTPITVSSMRFFVGRDALGKFAGDLRTTHSDFVYTPHRVPQALTTLAVWRGGRVRVERSRTTLAWT